MASPQQQDKKIGFKAINICKDQTLGIGAYGAVYKAKCDDLLCAAKIIHPTLFDSTALHQIPSHREHRLPISGGFKGGPEGAQAHPVIGPLLVTC